MNKVGKLVILGDGGFAEVAFEYFTHQSEFEVVGFAVERTYLKRDGLFGKPVVAVEDMEQSFAPADHHFYAALAYNQLNRLRARLYAVTKAKGYRPASFVSPNAHVWPNVRLGEHCFIFESNVIQPFVEIGNNVVLWSGNHIGHHSRIGDNCFIASHVVVSGFTTIGENAFLGVNATIGNNLTIGKDCLIGAGALVIKDVDEDRVVPGVAQEPAGSARRFSRVRG
jgi:sugar O-acyltransferase (sialic acid O-acetyltransferase NeuD family)